MISHFGSIFDFLYNLECCFGHRLYIFFLNARWVPKLVTELLEYFNVCFGHDIFTWLRSSGETQRVTNAGVAAAEPLRQSADGSVVMFYRLGWQVWRPE